jgi:hypothetical protein
LLTVKTPLNLWIADHRVTMRYYLSMVALILNSLLAYLALNLFTCTGKRQTHENHFPKKENADHGR